MQRITFGLVACLVVSACSITQTVDPIEDVFSREICVIENTAVKSGFIAELKNSLHAKNFTVRTLSGDATTNDCPTVATYTARWSWDLTIYMSYAEITVFQDGRLAGRALYDATSGGGRLDKFVDAEPKIRELVNQLFPGSYDFESVSSNPPVREPAKIMDPLQGRPTENDSRSPDLYEQLLKLDELRSRGILTEEEFEAEKKKLLGSS